MNGHVEHLEPARHSRSARASAGALSMEGMGRPLGAPHQKSGVATRRAAITTALG
jgi:hypothetical protein